MSSGRAALAVGGGAVDIAAASGGRFSSDVQDIYGVWGEFCDWARGFAGPADLDVRPGNVGCPVPRPPQVFAVGLNYRAHAVESGLPIPEIPVVFTKFPAAVTGPYDRVVLPTGPVDFEAEVVAVLGTRAENVAARDAWSHVAGLTVGQDLSQRAVQWAGDAPQQFSLGKSFAGFAPIGPVVVTPDEFDNPDDVEIACSLNGEQMQKSRTSDLVFSIPELIAYISAIVPMMPGDLLFTGTPSGVGFSRDPKIVLQPGDELTTSIDGVGSMITTFAARAAGATGSPT